VQQQTSSQPCTSYAAGVLLHLEANLRISMLARPVEVSEEQVSKVIQQGISSVHTPPAASGGRSHFAQWQAFTAIRDLSTLGKLLVHAHNWPAKHSLTTIMLSLCGKMLPVQNASIEAEMHESSGLFHLSNKSFFACASCTGHHAKTIAVVLTITS
jgi:hypothetical protein